MEKGKCPNPNGELGICYAFDRFGDRCGCVGCELLETLPNGMMNEGDPLPGLTHQLNSKEKRRDSLQRILDKMQTIKEKSDNGIDVIESNIKFLKDCQENKDDYASELHILTRDSVYLTEIAEIAQECLEDMALLSIVLYNGCKEEVKDMVEKPICCLCGQECENQWGNNPYPLSDNEKDRCCDICNMAKVVPARLGMVNTKSEEEKEEENKNM